MIDEIEDWWGSPGDTIPLDRGLLRKRARSNHGEKEHLDEEDTQSCRRLAATLCCKRPSPVTKGRVDGWAAGAAHAIGAVNFLFDASQTPHFKATELAALFGVSPATASARASEIRWLFDLHHFSVA